MAMAHWLTEVAQGALSAQVLPQTQGRSEELPQILI